MTTVFIRRLHHLKVHSTEQADKEGLQMSLEERFGSREKKGEKTGTDLDNL